MGWDDVAALLRLSDDFISNESGQAPIASSCFLDVHGIIQFPTPSLNSKIYDTI